MRKLAVIVLAAAGCYSPSLDPCEIVCKGADDTCPDGMTCESDGHCHQPNDTTSCETDFVLTVNKHGGGVGDITSDGALDCGNTCQITLAEGDSITLTAVPSTNMVFSGWGGDCIGTGDCTIVADADKNVDATFDATELVTVTFTGPGAGGVSSDPAGLDCDDENSSGCSMSFTQGTTLTLSEFTLDQQSFFNGWGGDCAFSQDDTCTIQIDGPKNISLDFE